MKRQDELNEAWCKYMNKCSTEIIHALAFELRWCDQHPRWISVEDELPEVGVKVLTTTQNGTRSVVYYDGSEWRAELPGFVRISVCMAYITHWMPLPQVPKGGEQ
jgi:hypothetical protein